MSGATSKCSTCGTEWEGYVVFCGECGTPMPRPPGPRGRIARRVAAEANAVIHRDAVEPPPPAVAKPTVRRPINTRNTLTGGHGSRGTNIGMPASQPPPPEPSAQVLALPPNPAPGVDAPLGAADPPAIRLGAFPAPRPPLESNTDAMLADLEAGFGSLAEAATEARTLGGNHVAEPPAAVAEPPAAPDTTPVADPVPVASPEAPAALLPAPEERLPPIQASVEAIPPATDAASHGRPPSADEPSISAEPLLPAEEPAVAVQPPPVEEQASAEGSAASATIPEPSSPVVDVTSEELEGFAESAIDALGAPEPVGTASPDRTSARDEQHLADMRTVRELFSEMAGSHARPLRDFMIELGWGEATKDWLDVSIPATISLRSAAEALDMADLCAALQGVFEALSFASAHPERTLAGSVKSRLEEAYRPLIEILPAAFALDGERGRREPIIVRSLLLQVPGVHRVALDKIYAAGINALGMFYASKPGDIAAATGLSLEVSARIIETFLNYRRAAEDRTVGPARLQEHQELEQLVATLGDQNTKYDRLSSAWSVDAANHRVRMRDERATTLLRIEVILARLGEVDRVLALAKLPFAGKVRELLRYLQEARERAERT